MVDVPKMERHDVEVDRRVYLGVILRMMMAGPVMLLGLVLPHVAPLDWSAVAGAIFLFLILGGVALLSARRPHLREQPPFVVLTILLATGAAGFSIVATQDLATTATLTLVVAMAYQINGRRHWGHTLFAWIIGTATFAAAQQALGAPTDHLVTRVVLFAGLTGVILATVRFLVASVYQSQDSARSLARLARTAAAARELAEGIARAESDIAYLTGARRVALWFEADGEVPDGGSDHMVLPLGTADRGPANLVIWGVQRPEFVHAIADLFSQVCERDRVLGDLLRHSTTDAVTGLGNRRALDHAIADPATGEHRTVVMLDLDRFKDFNDQYGHLAGDELLTRFADVLVQEVRPGDQVARYGGEEFCLLVEAGVDVATRVIERIREAWEAQQEAVTFSAGVAIEGDEPDSALQRADVALYRAKAAGRNCTVVHDPTWDF